MRAGELALVLVGAGAMTAGCGLITSDTLDPPAVATGGSAAGAGGGGGVLTGGVAGATPVAGDGPCSTYGASDPVWFPEEVSGQVAV